MKYDSETGWYLPDHEKHLIEWMMKVKKRRGDRLLYQGHKYDLALSFCREKRVAIDIGGHVGLWSWQMAQDFESVNAFEPMPDHADCFERNLAGFDSVTLNRCALGPERGEVVMRTRTADSSGDTGIEPDAPHDLPGGHMAEMHRLDDFDLVDVDFIKIDCEGYELFVLQGAMETLKRCKPCIIVEQKPETGMEARYNIGTTDAVKLLESIGAKRRKAIQGDYILSW